MLSVIQTGFYNKLKTYPSEWAATTSYALHTVINPTVYNDHTYKVTTAGTSGGTQPTWGTTNGGTTADGTVVWTCCDTKTYNTKAPQGATVPYVTFGLETDRPLGTFKDLEGIEDLTFWINCFSSISAAHVSAMGDLILAVMDDASLSVSGYSPMVCRREFIGTVIWDDEALIYQLPLRYRVQISL